MAKFKHRASSIQHPNNEREKHHPDPRHSHVLLGGGFCRWVDPEENGYYLKFSANYLDTAFEYNHEGQRLDLFAEQFAFEDASFRDVNFSFYGEYGLTERMTLVGSLPAKILTARRTELIAGRAARILTLHTTGLADLTVSGRFRLWNNPLALSFQGGVKIPLGYDKQPENEGAPLGSGEPDVEGLLQFGKGSAVIPGYVTGSVGYRFRSGPLNDQILYLFEAGVRVPGRLLFKVTFDGIQSTVTPPDIAGQTISIPLPGGGGTFPNIIVGDQHVWKISPALIYDIERGVSVQLEMLNIFAGKNTIAGNTFSLGMVFAR